MHFRARDSGVRVRDFGAHGFHVVGQVGRICPCAEVVVESREVVVEVGFFQPGAEILVALQSRDRHYNHRPWSMKPFSQQVLEGVADLT